MEKVTVKLNISEQEAIKAGRSEYGTVEKEFDPAILNPEQRAMLAQENLKTGPLNTYHPRFAHLDDFDAAVTQTLDYKIEEEKRKIEEEKDEVIEIATWPLERLKNHTHRSPEGRTLNSYHGDKVRKHTDELPETAALIKRNLEILNNEDKENDLKRAEREARAKREQEKKTERAVALCKERQAFVKKMLSSKPVVFEQYERGMLSEPEQRKMACDVVFAALDGWPRYERIRGSDVCDCGANGDATSFEVDEAENLSTNTFRDLVELEKKATAFKIEPREHVGECGYCDSKLTRYSAHVSFVIGDWTLTREFALDD
jgi:hypothetical protein